MSATTRALRPADHDVAVVWADGMRPANFAHEAGMLFFVKGTVAWVYWGSNPAPMPIARTALRVVKGL